MARAIWKGAISFGLINVPVEVHSAVKDAEASVSFNMLHRGCNSRINMVKKCPVHGEITQADVVKGYEHTKGQYIVMDDADFAAAAIEATKQVEIDSFVSEDEIDSRFFEKPYFLLPQKGGEKVYALLRDAVRETGMVGIGNVSLKQNTMHLAALKAVDDALVLCMMRYADELVDPADITFPNSESVKPAELALAKQLVGSMVTTFDPSKFSDRYAANLRKIIADKASGQNITLPSVKEPEATGVADLLSKLQASLAASPKKVEAVEVTTPKAKRIRRPV